MPTFLYRISFATPYSLKGTVVTKHYLHDTNVAPTIYTNIAKNFGILN